MTALLDVDYLVVGAGAAGMAFTDSLVGHSDARVALIDRRHAPGGHWLDAYPFVQLHQASAFYGVASTELGTGQLQQNGPEAGLHERATAAQVCAYYAQVLDAMTDRGQVTFIGNVSYLGDREFVSRLTGQRYRVRPECRIVDGTYLAPDIPSQSPPPFEVTAGSMVVPVNDLVHVAEPPGGFVIVGSGKTATDAIVWLLRAGVDPNAICWVRPRDPWMLNRATVQPDPAIFFQMAADVMQAAIDSDTPDQMFEHMEQAGVMMRIDRSVAPTMAKAPTLAEWELDLLGQVERVLRRGHVRAVEPDRLCFADGHEQIVRGSIVVHCAAPGLKYPPRMPIWTPDAIRPQPVRAGFPCFGAAVAGYVEATREDDAERNRICRPSSLPDTTAGWCAMQAIGGAAAQLLAAEPDIKQWANGIAINPAAVSPEDASRPEVTAALTRFASVLDAGLAACRQLAG